MKCRGDTAGGEAVESFLVLLPAVLWMALGRLGSDIILLIVVSGAIPAAVGWVQAVSFQFL